MFRSINNKKLDQEHLFTSGLNIVSGRTEEWKITGKF
jgi:hypothetical protein